MEFNKSSLLGETILVNGSLLFKIKYCWDVVTFEPYVLPASTHMNERAWYFYPRQKKRW
jgi:hypothetical protein